LQIFFFLLQHQPGKHGDEKLQSKMHRVTGEKSLQILVKTGKLMFLPAGKMPAGNSITATYGKEQAKTK